MNDQEVIEKSKSWIADFVIGLRLCPFARLPYDRDQIRYKVIRENGTEAMLLSYWDELVHLRNTPKDELSTTIMIFPESLADFDDYLDFYHLAEELLGAEGLTGEFQLAGFHPEYRFEGTKAGDVSNYTNRSPFPFVHLLRVEEVREAIENYPEIAAVPERNMDLMKTMGLDKIKKLLK